MSAQTTECGARPPAVVDDAFLPLFLDIDPAVRPSSHARAHGRNRTVRSNESPAPLATTAATLDGLVVSLEQRDPATGRHCRRVGSLADALAGVIGLRGDDRRIVRLAGLAHDVGKHLVPEDLLRSGVRLEAASIGALRSHPALAESLVAFLPGVSLIVPAIRAHHERWDGTGYPDAVAGAAIPLAARIVAVADAFDAMRMKRAYAAASSDADARREIARGAGTQFDPAVARLLDQVDTTAHAARLAIDSAIVATPERVPDEHAASSPTSRAA